MPNRRSVHRSRISMLTAVTQVIKILGAIKDEILKQNSNK
jgi:hypothetical protein